LNCSHRLTSYTHRDATRRGARRTAYSLGQNNAAAQPGRHDIGAAMRGRTNQAVVHSAQDIFEIKRS